MTGRTDVLRRDLEAADIRGWVFDGDNCLWRCTEYYEDARQQVANMAVAMVPGLETRAAMKRIFEIDAKNVKVMNFQRERFPTTLRESLISLALEGGVTLPAGMADEAYALGMAIFDAPYSCYDGAFETLVALKQAGCRLALCTKGEDDIQRRKLDLNGLWPIFDHVSIVLPVKTGVEIGATADALGLPRENVVMVGDSLIDDIVGGTDAGLRTVFVNGDLSKAPAINPALADRARPTMTIPAVADLPATLHQLAQVAA